MPASVLLCAAMFYWCLVILAGLDLDILDFDLDLDAEPDFESMLGMGFVVLRFLNIGRVPVMLWGSIFAVTFWLVSMLLDRYLDQGLFEEPEHRWAWFYVVQFTVRNLAFAVILTKLFTHPLRDKFEPDEPNQARDLIGTPCIILTSEVTERHGQAEYKTGAAPLLLNVRVADANGPLLRKGDTAMIIDFDPGKNIYLVKKPNAED